MRTAILSDIHGNITALDAVIVDLRNASPDLVIHGGDLATHGHRPDAAIDRVREHGWPGVVGNTDEMLWSPELINTLRRESPRLSGLYDVLFQEIAPETRERVGTERVAWLRQLERVWQTDRLVVLHATAESLWRAPMADATDETLAAAYRRLGARVVYGHIHRPFVRVLSAGAVVANCGSVGLSFDGDPRASYLLIDDQRIEIRRVAYDVEREVKGLFETRYPRADWLAGVLRTASYSPPV